MDNNTLGIYWNISSDSIFVSTPSSAIALMVNTVFHDVKVFIANRTADTMNQVPPTNGIMF